MSADPSSRSEIVGIRPYARLLTMLGEQLIKNDRIALVELIKNCYDADAARVLVDFIGFSDSLENVDGSTIALVDNGIGMSESTIRDHWLNPATPDKEDRKREEPTTKRGRVVQGEKGIGRFAIFKLGSRATIVTRSEESADEFVLEYDLSFLDPSPAQTELPVGEEAQADEPASSDADPGKDPTFVDEIEVRLTRRRPEVFDGTNPAGLASVKGTRIEVSSLRSDWSEAMVRKAYGEVARLQPLVPIDEPAGVPAGGEAIEPDFVVSFSRDGENLPYREEVDKQLQRLFSERAVLSVRGRYSEPGRAFALDVNGHQSWVDLTDPALAGLRIYKKYFGRKDDPRSPDDVECGSFEFRFFIFDFSPGAPVQHKLDSDERARVKDHRIYLYRDGVRVLPYGDPDDDWLQLDVIRGTQGASRVLSNDQTVGFVYITQDGNRRLKDKTNREGLLESGRAFEDFVTLLQLVVSYLRAGEFARYLANEASKRAAEERKQRPIEAGLERLMATYTLPEAVRVEIQDLGRSYAAEKRIYQNRVDRTEDLAGVGLSVEAASHDIVATANQALRHARSILDYVTILLEDEQELLNDVEALVEALSFVSSRLQDIQGLFVSTRQRRRPVVLAEYVARVERIYSSLLAQAGVRVEVLADSTLLVNSTDAALLQVLINLFDNSLYWLSTSRTSDPTIVIVIDVTAQTLLFADNGPGVRAADAPYIFEPFYSGKGEEGKGLGLYIARQVGARSGFSVELVGNEGEKILSGANFRLAFGEAESHE